MFFSRFPHFAIPRYAHNNVGSELLTDLPYDVICLLSKSCSTPKPHEKEKTYFG